MNLQRAILPRVTNIWYKFYNWKFRRVIKFLMKISIFLTFLASDTSQHLIWPNKIFHFNMPSVAWNFSAPYARNPCLFLNHEPRQRMTIFCSRDSFHAPNWIFLSFITFWEVRLCYRTWIKCLLSLKLKCEDSLNAADGIFERISRVCNLTYIDVFHPFLWKLGISLWTIDGKLIIHGS